MKEAYGVWAKGDKVKLYQEGSFLKPKDFNEKKLEKE